MCSLIIGISYIKRDTKTVELGKKYEFARICRKKEVIVIHLAALKTVIIFRF